VKVWALVPVKPYDHAKTRLAGVLSVSERRTLVEKLLRHNLEVLCQSAVLAGVLVVSRDLAVLETARSFAGVQTLQEVGTPELNQALMLGSRTLLGLGADAMLILPADLPLTRREDIETMVDLGHNPYTIVIAPDHHEDGTNALLCHPPQLISFRFGMGSFQQHIQQAKRVGAAVYIYTSAHLALDIDTPEDFKAALRAAVLE